MRISDWSSDVGSSDLQASNAEHQCGSDSTAPTPEKPPPWKPRAASGGRLIGWSLPRAEPTRAVEHRPRRLGAEIGAAAAIVAGQPRLDRNSDVAGKGVSVRLDSGGARCL